MSIAGPGVQLSVAPQEVPGIVQHWPDAGVAIKGFTIFLLPPQRKINEVIGLLSAIFGY
jgi:hypothetical protein